MSALRDEDGYEWYFGIPFKSKRAAVERGPKYKAGDVVRVVDASGGGKVGDVATVTEVDDSCLEYDGFFYQLTGLSDGCEGLFEKRLSIHFTPGTRVRLKRHVHRFTAGDTGTVTVSNDDNVGVRMDEGRYWSFSPEVLEVVPEPWLAGEWESAPDCSANNGEREAKPKYKAGDVVTTKGAGGDPGVGEILSYEGNGYYKVKFSTWYGTCTEPEAWLTHVTSAPANDPAQSCIVMRLDNGKPRPSYCPHVHDTAASATTEAERLASINPGKQFDVYQRVTGRVAEQHIEMKVA